MMTKAKFETLLQGWLAQTLSADEIEEFLGAVQLPGYRQLLEERLLTDLAANTYTGSATLQDQQTALEQILQQIKVEKKSVKVRHLALRYWVAAAIFLLMAGAGFLYYSRGFRTGNATEPVVAQHRGDPAAKPFLVLANGNTVLLENIKNKKIKGLTALEGSIIYSDDAGLKTETHQLQNPAGSNPLKLILSDGTGVLLNAASSLTYTNRFTQDKREILLVGEAYFDVTKNREKPFIVHTGTMDVKVLGTAFNVKSYPNDPSAQTTLLRGSVEVTVNKQPDRKIVLKPNEKIEISGGRMLENTEDRKAIAPPLKISITTAPVAGNTAIGEDILWTKNRLAFDYVELAEVALMIERWYGVKVNIENPSLLTKRFSGNFENRPIEEVLKALQLVGKFRYERQGNLIIIK